MARTKTSPVEVETISDPVLGELVKLEAADKLDVETILALAVDPESPLHGEFEWDDSVAGHEWRRVQVRKLLGRFRVVRMVNGSGPIPVPRFVHIPPLARSVSHDTAMVDWRAEIEAKAVRDLRSWWAKYRRLGDDNLAAMFAALTADD